MSGRYVLDTNIVIALFDGDKSVRDRVAAADEIFIPAIVLGELYFGALRSNNPEDNIARIDDLARSFAILLIDESTAKIYGMLQRDLYAVGKPIPKNDVWIAATARQCNCTIATRDDHFTLLSSVVVEKW